MLSQNRDEVRLVRFLGIVSTRYSLCGNSLQASMKSVRKKYERQVAQMYAKFFAHNADVTSEIGSNFQPYYTVTTFTA